MQALVAREMEPITPLIAKVGALAEAGISTVLCVGGCGDYFDVADTVIMADAFQYYVRLRFCTVPPASKHDLYVLSMRQRAQLAHGACVRFTHASWYTVDRTQQIRRRALLNASAWLSPWQLDTAQALPVCQHKCTATVPVDRQKLRSAIRYTKKCQ